MASICLQVNDVTVYNGPMCAVPRVSEDIHHHGQVVRVEAVVWKFEGPVVNVTLLVGGQPYTF